ncbi:MAG: hypothetical protein H0U59_13590 [Gemmatimonadaceae bacterium]|nr:hypothetical protein [Gemmatimonadaceae bacterium]
MTDVYLADKRSAITWAAGIIGSLLTVGLAAIMGMVVTLNSRVAVLESQTTAFRDSLNQISGKLDALLIQSRN